MTWTVEPNPIHRLFAAVAPALLVLLAAWPLGAAVSPMPTPVSVVNEVAPLDAVPEVLLPMIDTGALLLEDEQNAGRKDLPFRYAAEVPTQISLLADGLHEQLPNSDHLWRLRITSILAYTLSFQLKPFYLPPGAQLFLYAPDGSVVWGPYTHLDNSAGREFWTPAVPYDSAVLELYLPAGAEEQPLLGVETAVHAYKDTLLKAVSPDKPNPGGSGTCNVDVACEQAQWGNEINSVAHYVFGMYMCTGTLINRIPGDCVPYFWTANHCVSTSANASKVVTYWNFERSSCGSGTGPTNHTVSGSSLVWTYSGSDSTLLQLSALPPSAYVPYLAGWDAAATSVSSATCIHHPSGDYKKISHENQALTITTYLQTASPGDGTHWRVADWDSGTTEGGSSGSGLWADSTRRLVGQLHGGYAACGNNSADWYGRILTAWNNGANAHLDPGGTGTKYVNGKNYTQCSVCTPPAAPSGLTVTNACNGISLSWTASGADGYNIYRKVGTCGGTYTPIASGITGTTYTNSGLTAGSQYSYVVRGYAGDTTCESGDSNCVTATVQSTPAAPAAPTVTDDCVGLVVSWTAVSGATAYDVYRKAATSCTKNGWSIPTGGGNITATTWTDTGAAAGTTYGYYIVAKNACGSSGDYPNCGIGTHTLSGPPGTPSITGITDEDACAQSGIHINYASGTGATSHNLVRSGTVVVTGYASGALYNPGATTSYNYVVRAVNACGSTDSAAQAFADANAKPGSPTITGITDNDPCAQNGIRVAYTAGSGATGHNLYRDGALVVTGYVSNAVYNPGDGASHSYVVRAVNGSCYTDSGAQAFTDGNGAPGAPVITGIADADACAQNGIRVAYTAGSGSTSHDLLRNGTVVVTGYTSNALYNPGSTTSYNYAVRAVNACGSADSAAQAFSDANAMPGAPAITGITDADACAQSGIRIAYTAGSGATSHNLLRDGVSVVSGYASNALYNPGDGASHNYAVRAVNGTCTADSAAQAFSDANNSTTPTITGAGANACPAVTVDLTTQTGMTGYQWYRDAAAIGGATTSAYTVVQSGTYTVRYTNGSGCTATSAGHTVSIVPCIPNIAYLSHTGPVEVEGDGDGVLEAGEKWQITVTVTNNGQAPAAAVVGSLAGEGIVVCDNPGAFGGIAVGQTGAYAFTFIPDPASWYGTHPCGASIGFDLIDKSSDGGTYSYAADADFTTRQVGALGGITTENATAPNIVNAKNGSKSSTFSPAFTLTPAVESAAVAFTLSSHPNPDACVQVELVAPDNAALTLKGYGEAAQASYEATAFYNGHGAGAWVLRVSEQSGCGAANDSVNAGGIAMTVEKIAGDPQCDTGTASCLAIVPEVSGDALHRMTAAKNAEPARVDLVFEDVSAAAYNLYVSNDPSTHPFQVASPLLGNIQCGITSTAQAGGMRLTEGVTLEEGITGPTAALYFLVTADSGAGTEGPLGTDSVPTPRDADGYCAR